MNASQMEREEGVGEVRIRVGQLERCLKGKVEVIIARKEREVMEGEVIKMVHEVT